MFLFINANLLSCSDSFWNGFSSPKLLLKALVFMMLIHVQTCVLGVNLKSYSHFRDVSFNELTSFPTEGLNGLNQLKLVGNFKLKEALAAKDFVNLRCVFLFCDSFGRPSDYRVSCFCFFFFFAVVPRFSTSILTNLEKNRALFHCCWEHEL